MVNLENQGVMTEFDAVHGISTSELRSLFFKDKSSFFFMPKISLIFSDNNSKWLSYVFLFFSYLFLT